MSSVIVSGVKELNASLDALELRMSEAARNTVVKGGAVVAKAAKEEFTELGISKSGEVRVIDSTGRKRGEISGAKYKGPNIHGTRPHARTGKLRTSIGVHEVSQVGPGRWMSKTGPTMAYGRRVELGFVGADARGRRYNQPGYPYMAPGFEKARPEIVAIYEEEVRKALEHG
jgi:hypothetical protein